MSSNHSFSAAGAMKGVRRWMGSQTNTGMHNLTRKSTNSSEVNEPRREPDRLEKNSTEYIANRLMNPDVPADERRQYEG